MKFHVFKFSVLGSALCFSACVSSPKGTPTKTKAANTAALAAAVAGGVDLNPSYRLGDRTADSSRIEILATGLLRSARVTPISC